MVKNFRKFGNVIFGWKNSPSVAFASILHRYIPPPATIIDLCAGERKMYDKMNDGHHIDKENYTLIFGDIREIPGLDYVCDIRKPPKELFGIGDGYVFDPPWPSQSAILKDVLYKFEPMNKKDFPQFLEDSYNTIDKILKDKGILVVKSTHPWNHIIFNSLLERGYKWIRDIPQICVQNKIPFISYYQIFRKQSCGVHATPERGSK